MGNGVNRSRCADCHGIVVIVVRLLLTSGMRWWCMFQGSTIRKRKMYEEFLSKVSILGEHLSDSIVFLCMSLAVWGVSTVAQEMVIGQLCRF